MLRSSQPKINSAQRRSRLSQTFRPRLQTLENRTLLNATMVADINDNTGAVSAREAVVMNDDYYFVGSDGITGVELWRTDGTEAGTWQVKDTHSGFLPFVEKLTVVGSSLFFTASDGAGGTGIWKSDGTTAGTSLVKAGISVISEYRSTAGWNGLFFFVSAATGNNYELWRSDGTDAGTFMVKDIMPGSVASYPRELTPMPNGVYFRADDGVNGIELWKSDGTEGGTAMVENINSGGNSSHPEFLENVDGTLFFGATNGTAGTEIWRSDGTPGGTNMVLDIESGGNGARFRYVAHSNGTLYFEANTSANGYSLWRTDGTDVNTSLVKDLTPGSSSYTVGAGAMLNGTLYFAGKTTDPGTELWISDGTSGGTNPIRSFPNTSMYPREFTILNGKMYFSSDITGSYDFRLFQSDGTAGGTVQVGDIRLSSAASFLCLMKNVNNSLIFSGYAPIVGEEFWRSDGTVPGTQLIKDINVLTGDSTPSLFYEMNGATYFSATNGRDGAELWKTDGTEAGTEMVADIFSGANGSSPRNFANFNGTLFFAAGDATNGIELWRSDGTAAGTTLVKNIASSNTSSFPANLTVYNGTLFFAATTIAEGRELWITDGTDAGTVLFKDINPNAGFGDPQQLLVMNGTMFFKGNDGSAGYELWRSDGTPVGTVPVLDIENGPVGSNPDLLTNVNGTLFFVASTTGVGAELWRSDGTDTGTSLVKDISNGGGGANISQLTNLNGSLFFSARDESFVTKLWTSDGTDPGTVAVTDHAPTGMIVHNGLLYFSSTDATYGIEVWKSNGTDAGTVLLKDIVPNSQSSSPVSLTSVGDSLFFSANVPTTGYELWQSDGTDGGTTLVSDIYPDTISGTPAALANINGTLYFSARSPLYGIELWKVEVGVPTNQPPNPDAGGPYNMDEGTMLVLDASASSDPENDPLTYSWDVNGDGTFGDAIGETPSLTWSELQLLGVDGGSLTYLVSVQVSDGINSAVTSTSVLLTVTNIAPTATLSDSGTAAEGQAVTFTVSNQDDPSPADVSAGFVYSYDFNNDGDFADAGELSQVSAASAATVFDDNGSYTIRARIEDRDGGFADYTSTVTLTNVAPTATLGNSGPVNEGVAATVSFANQSDPSAADLAAGLLYSFDIDNDGDFTSPGDLQDTATPSVAFTPNDNGVYTIGARIRDKDGGFNDYLTVVTVTNVAPSATFSNSGPISEGNQASISFLNPSDPSTADVAAGFLFSYDLNNDGDFADPGDFAAVPDTNKLLPFTESGVFVVRGRIQDKDGGFQDFTTSVTIQNVAPTGSFSNAGGAQEGNPVTVHFTNQDDVSPEDEAAGFLYSYDFNNDGDFTDAGEQVAVSSTTATVTFPGNGTYTVHGRIEDKDGGFTDYTTQIAVSNLDVIVAGFDKGGQPRVRVLDAETQEVKADFLAYDAAFKKGLRVAVGDVTGDGTPDIVVGPGPGGKLVFGTLDVKVFDGISFTAVESFRPFGDLFRKGVNVAVGDLDADGFADIVVAPNAGFEPRIKVISGADGSFLFDFVAFPSVGSYRKGVRVAVGDVNGDGRPDIVAQAGSGGFSRIKVFDGTTGLALEGGFANLNPFGDNPAIRSGLYVAAGDVTGDGRADIIVGILKGVPLLRVFDGVSGARIAQANLTSGLNLKAGARVAVTDTNGDGRAEILISSAKVKKSSPNIRVLDGQTLSEIDSIFADPSNAFKGGLFVAGGR